MIEHSEQLDKLATALSAAQGQIKVAIKDSTNPHFKSRYADLGSVWDACKDALSANELSIVQSPGFNDDAQSVYLTTMLLHKSGQWMRGVSGCKPKDGSPQSVGSAITYLRRYGLAALLGVVSDDDDAESAQPERRQQQSKPQPVPAAKPTPQQATVNAQAPAQITAAQRGAIVKICNAIERDPENAADFYFQKKLADLTFEQAKTLLEKLNEVKAKIEAKGQAA